jgi:hypothetical protein
MDEIQKLLNDNAALPLWPEVGALFHMSRPATYRAAASGDIKTIRLGRLMRVPTAWLREQLGLTESRPAA